MTTNLQLTGRASFASPLTYGKAIREGQVIRVHDDEAAMLLGLASTFTEYLGAQPVSYDFTDDATGETFFDGSVAITPALLSQMPSRIQRGVMLRDRDGFPYGYSDGKGGFVPLTPAVSAESAGVSYSATPAQNSLRLNWLLSTQRVVTLSRPGQYLFGGPGQDGIVIPRNRTLIVGNGVELILANQTYEPLLRTERCFDPGTAAVGSIAYTGGGWGLRGTVTAPGIHLKHPVGSWIGVLGLDLAQGNNRSYQGVYQVTAVTTSPDAIIYEMVDTPPSGGNSTTGAMIYPVDDRIRIHGGLWDGNGINNGQGGGSPYYQGDPHSHIMCWRNVQDVIVTDPKFRRGYSWSIGTNNIRDCTFRDLYGDLYGDGLGTANAIFQGSGGARNVLIDGVTGTCEDNMVAWSLDHIGSWTYQDHWYGDVHDLRIKNVCSAAGNATVVNFWGNTNARYHSVEVENVSGRTSAGSMVGVDNGFTQTSMLNTRGGTLKIKNINGQCPGGTVDIRSDGDWDHIEIDGVQSRRPTNSATPCVTFRKRTGGTVQTIKRLDIRNVNWHVPGSTGNRTGPLVDIADTNVNDLKVSGIPLTRLNVSGTGIVNFSGTEGVVNNAVVSDVRGQAVITGDTCLVRCANTGAGALGQLTLRDCSMTGFDASGGLVHQTTTGKVARVRIDNTPVPALTRAGGTNISGVLRDGTGCAVDVVSVTATVAN